jgi:hypothetical protein
MCVPKKIGGMGFRDIHCFNLALLAKQAWRLISKPESLCATVLRAKYYSDGDLLEEILKMGSSYTWQSIMCGVNTLKKGYIWRVGDGSKINIWNDARIPGSHDRKIVTRRGHNLLTHVSDLIDPITDRWDEELVKQTFWSIDIGRILAIPLTDPMEDFIAWHYNKNAVFSVKSAYHVEWDFQHGQKLRRTNGVGNSTVNPVWGKLWNLNIAVKVNIFLWKALHATMPCRAILANRHIKISGQCPVCCAGAEDIKHALFQCKRLHLDSWILLTMLVWLIVEAKWCWSISYVYQEEIH